MNTSERTIARPIYVVPVLAALGLACASVFAQPWNITIDTRNQCSSDDNGPGTVITMPPGKYIVTPVSGAVNVWGGVVDLCDANGQNCNAGWMFLYYVRVGQDPGMTYPPGCCPSNDRWASPALTLAHARTAILRVAGPTSRPVKFYFVDSVCADNVGNIGIQVALACAADFNSDEVVDFFDYLDFVDAFSAFSPIADVNNDGVIDFFDYLDFVDAFSTGCAG